MLVFTFPDEGVRATAELLAELAPETVAGVVAALPLAGICNHGIYSGSEIAFLISTDIWLPQENATSRVLPGDLAYYKFTGGELYGWSNSVAELCWFYDRDARPSMPDGPVAVNVFGRFTHGWDEFAAVCRAMRMEGAKRIRVTGS